MWFYFGLLIDLYMLFSAILNSILLLMHLGCLMLGKIVVDVCVQLHQKHKQHHQALVTAFSMKYVLMTFYIAYTPICAYVCMCVCECNLSTFAYQNVQRMREMKRELQAYFHMLMKKFAYNLVFYYLYYKIVLFLSCCFLNHLFSKRILRLCVWHIHIHTHIVMYII